MRARGQLLIAPDDVETLGLQLTGERVGRVELVMVAAGSVMIWVPVLQLARLLFANCADPRRRGRAAA